MKKLKGKIIDLFEKGMTADEIGKTLCINPNVAADVINEYLIEEEERYFDELILTPSFVSLR